MTNFLLTTALLYRNFAILSCFLTLSALYYFANWGRFVIRYFVLCKQDTGTPMRILALKVFFLEYYTRSAWFENSLKPFLGGVTTY